MSAVKAEPRRLQLSRRKGARLPAGAVSVARPSKYGNPFRIVPDEDDTWAVVSPKGVTLFIEDEREDAARRAVTLYRQALLAG